MDVILHHIINTNIYFYISI